MVDKKQFIQENKLSFPISEVMQKNFVYFLANTYIEKALDEMSEKDLIGVPVVDEDMRPVGYMSERECLKVAMRLRYHNSQAAHVGDYMGETVITLPNTMTISDATEEFSKNWIHSYPVVDAANRVIGVVHRHDILRFLKNIKKTTWFNKAA